MILDRSHLVTFLLVISDKTTKKELHSETVGFFFKNREIEWFRGIDHTFYEDHSSMAYWLNNNTSAMLFYRFWNDDKFRTNNQRAKFEACLEKLRANKNHQIEAVMVETFTGKTFEAHLRLDVLKKDPANIIWQGQFT